MQAGILMAYGSCACIGGINGLRLKFSPDEAKHIVYNGRKYHLEAGRPRPLSDVVKVDYHIPGCPTNNQEFVTALKSILIGKGYRPPNYAVCVECKFKENVCLFEKGQVCMGPFTRAGCGAWCICYGNTCYGCRGLLNGSVNKAQMDILLGSGYSIGEIKQKFETYNLCKIKGGRESE